MVPISRHVTRILLLVLIIIQATCENTKKSDNTSLQPLLMRAAESKKWSPMPSFATPRNGHTCVVNDYMNWYVYVIGGADNASYYNDVQYAPIDCDGTIGSWASTSSFTNARANHAGIVYNGYVYIIGGYDGSVVYNDVQYAKINSNGTIDAWSSTTQFQNGRFNHTGAAYNGYMYIIGGAGINTSYYDVQFATINSDGTLGAWSYTMPLPMTRTGHAGAVYNGYIYVMGGFRDANRSDDVLYAKINSDGTLGTWSVTTSFSTARSDFAGVASYYEVSDGAYVYIFGGRTDGKKYCNDVQRALINSDGTLGSWSTISWFPNARYSPGGLVWYCKGNYNMYIIGGFDGTSSCDDVLIRSLDGL